MSRELAGMLSHCVGTLQAQRTVSDPERNTNYRCRRKYGLQVIYYYYLIKSPANILLIVLE